MLKSAMEAPTTSVKQEPLQVTYQSVEWNNHVLQLPHTTLHLPDRMNIHIGCRIDRFAVDPDPEWMGGFIDAAVSFSHASENRPRLQVETSYQDRLNLAASLLPDWNGFRLPPTRTPTSRQTARIHTKGTNVFNKLIESHSSHMLLSGQVALALRAFLYGDIKRSEYEMLRRNRLYSPVPVNLQHLAGYFSGGKGTINIFHSSYMSYDCRREGRCFKTVVGLQSVHKGFRDALLNQFGGRGTEAATGYGWYLYGREAADLLQMLQPLMMTRPEAQAIITFQDYHDSLPEYDAYHRFGTPHSTFAGYQYYREVCRLKGITPKQFEAFL